MEKLKLYTVDTKYIDYLAQYDKQVMSAHGDSYKTERKYLGVVLNIGDFQYFAPLSSPKDSDYFYKKGKRIVRKSVIPLIRLVTDKGVLLGRVKLNNMIPVPKRCLTLYDVENEADVKYKDLISDEIICVRKRRELILKNAKVLYNQKINNYEGINYLNSTVDFRTAEKYCKEYQKQ